MLIPRIRLSTFFALLLISALAVQNMLLKGKISESSRLRQKDVVAIQVPGFTLGDLPKFLVQDTDGRREVQGLPITINMKGNASLPGVGDVQLAGLTCEEACTAIASAYCATGTIMNPSNVKIEALIKRIMDVVRE